MDPFVTFLVFCGGWLGLTFMEKQRARRGLLLQKRAKQAYDNQLVDIEYTRDDFAHDSKIYTEGYTDDVLLTEGVIPNTSDYYNGSNYDYVKQEFDPLRWVLRGTSYFVAPRFRVHMGM